MYVRTCTEQKNLSKRQIQKRTQDSVNFYTVVSKVYVEYSSKR
jgi:hypothetical protein